MEDRNVGTIYQAQIWAKDIWGSIMGSVRRGDKWDYYIKLHQEQIFSLETKYALIRKRINKDGRLETELMNSFPSIQAAELAAKLHGAETIHYAEECMSRH